MSEPVDGPPSDELDVERLRQITDDMIEAITAPAFVEALLAVRDAPAEDRLAEGSRRLTPEALRAQGVPLPEGMRISSRYFEDGLPNPVEFGDDVSGRRNLVNSMNRSEPGALDRLRTEDPEAFRALVKLPPGLATPVGRFQAGGCACGGVGGACGGAGWT